MTTTAASSTPHLILASEVRPHAPVELLIGEHITNALDPGFLVGQLDEVMVEPRALGEVAATTRQPARRSSGLQACEVGSLAGGVETVKLSKAPIRATMAA